MLDIWEIEHFEDLKEPWVHPNDDFDGDGGDASRSQVERSSSWGSKKDVPIAAVKPVGHEEEEEDTMEEVEDIVLKLSKNEDEEEEEDSDLMQSILSELSSRDVGVMNTTSESIEISESIDIESDDDN